MISKAYQHEENIKSIIGVDISQKALVKAIELGADHVINSSGLTNDEVAQQVLALTQGLGCELCIDAAGFSSSCEQAVISTRRGCRMVQVGLPIGGRLPEINMGMVAGRELELVGSHGFSAKNLPDLLNLVKTGKLQVKKLVENEVTLEEGAKALMDMDSHSPLGMTIITKFQHCKM
jgi:alcohol dehydrogenase